MLDYPADGWYNGNIIKAQEMSQMEKANMPRIDVVRTMPHIIMQYTDECVIVRYYRGQNFSADSWLIIYL